MRHWPSVSVLSTALLLQRSLFTAQKCNCSWQCYYKFRHQKKIQKVCQCHCICHHLCRLWCHHRRRLRNCCQCRCKKCGYDTEAGTIATIIFIFVTMGGTMVSSVVLLLLSVSSPVSFSDLLLVLAL